MTYELAKKLKDAGFPQNFVEGRKAIVNVDNTEYCFEPTLAELIEACGDGFKNLTKDTLDWKCNYFMNGEEVDSFDSWDSTGSTPEEAVANLWLALNKK